MNDRMPSGETCEETYRGDNQPFRCPFLDTESPYCQRFEKELVYNAWCRDERLPECMKESPCGGKIVIVEGE
jgi:hypothetical protein